jgi:predicted ATPase/DNA-binding SARP family transcriptional activator
MLLSRVAFRDQEISGPRLRDLLALLAADLRTGCSTARLVAGLWPDEQPANPAKALQILVSRLRAQLGADVITRTPTGYRLSLTEDQVDASAVLLSASASAQLARSGDHTAALARAEAGLALWEGGPGGDTEPGDPLSALRADRASTYQSLLRARGLALSRLGRHAEAVEDLAGVVRERPRDEEALLELLRCEAATAGPAAALARYDAYRRSLRDDLGTDPGSALQAAYQQLLGGQSPVVRHGVAHEPNPLLGRDDDIAAVAGLLRTSRVTSIVGTGGLGKTRLAHVVSRRAEQRVVHFDELAGVTADGDVAGEVASVLGVGDARGAPVGHLSARPEVGIVKALGSAPALLVLDNCEQVIGGAAKLVHALVSMTQDLRVLTTSRAPLGLSSESVYQLPELDLSTTVELFGQRARAARPGVDLPADVVAELCRHLDGLPLAVELAAARVRVLSVPEIAGRLEDRFSLLSGGKRDTPRRHRTLHAVVDWSWSLLDPAGQAAMRALSVFPGGFTAGAARHLLAGRHLGRSGPESLVGDTDVLQVLEHLVDQSLLKVSDTSLGTRLRMLETVREFSTAQREAAGETARAVGGFLGWARDFGVAHHESVFGPEPVPAIELIQAEQDNLVQALRYGLAQVDGGTVAATSAVLGSLWTVEAKYSRLLTLAEETGWILSHYRPEPELVEVTRMAATLCTVNTFSVQGPRAVRSLAVLRRLPPAPPGTLMGPIGTVLVATFDGRSGGSAMLALCDSAAPAVAGIANGIMTYVYESDSDRDGALKAAGRMLEVFANRPAPWMQVMAHSRISELYMQAEQGEEARRHLRAALQLLDGLGQWPDAVGIRGAMVQVNMQVGDVDEAEYWLGVASQDFAEDSYGLVTFDMGVRAEIQLVRGDVEAGLQLWRNATEHLANRRDPAFQIGPDALEPWALEVQAVSVVAHAYHGRLDLVEEIVAGLPHHLSTVLIDPITNPPPYYMDFPVGGALLLALANVDIYRGERSSGARLIALAERFHFLRGFQPTMSSARARETAERADKAAYDDAVSSYAGLDRDGLRAAALAALRARDQG